MVRGFDGLLAIDLGGGNCRSNCAPYRRRASHTYATVVPILQCERLKAQEEGDNGKHKYKYKAKRNKVCLCADDVPTPKKLEEYQTTYARAMTSFGLERGLHGSEAKHHANMAYYKELVKATENKKAEETQLQKSVAQLEKKAINSASRIRSTLSLAVRSWTKLNSVSKPLRRRRNKLNALAKRMTSAKRLLFYRTASKTRAGCWHDSGRS